MSDDGQVTTQTIDYTVRPNSRFTITGVKARKSGTVSLSLTLPGPGRVEVLETAPTANIAAALPPVGSGGFAFGRLVRQSARPVASTW